MLRIQMIGLALGAALAMSVVAASSASAAHLWLIGGKLVASEVKIHATDLFLLTDDTPPVGGATQIHCKRFDDGTVGPHALDLVLAITAELLGTNDKVHCTFDKTGGCESGSLLLALAIGLPWHTELYLEGTEVRDHIASSTPGGKIGWKVTCKAPLLGIITDECLNGLASVLVANVAGGVEGTYDAKSNSAECSFNGGAFRANAGLVRGTRLFENISATEKLTFD
jgi:hypothetical protein